ncbi:MAG TPA: hypothetical protein VIW23_05970 [Candidatus Acidoferrum sp.]|jgi:hypothetical protein
MNALKNVSTNLLACSLLLFPLTVSGFAQQNSDVSRTSAKQSLAERDGQHDFDFEIGTWKTHISRLQNPLTGSNNWVEYDGTSVVRPVWNGRANLVELEADGPAGHIEGLSLRLYNPRSHQWSLNFANSNSGTLSQPTIGEFKNGRGEFFDQETFNGRSVYVRFIISNITPNSCRFEQSFSNNGGKTWEPNWIATDARVTDESGKNGASKSVPTSSASGGQHDFDFEIGSWKIHLSRLKDRLAGSTTWVEFDGTSVTRPVWNGRANLEEFETDSQTGHIEGLTLRLYNPQSHQWSIYWANGKDAILGQPMIGEFKSGRGEFYDQEPWKDRAVFVRFIWSNTAGDKPHFEQAYSDDGGQTWEVNWITDQTRTNDASAKAN